jgi:NAD(P)H-hydrate repair Nnr-like enzyme with NAD(P)H-hydrate dehydratase domain/NAD(P)H-hydrate repair Nnr-like enzyme with NAD(P)H-hydrate epimerase domain
MSDFDPLYTAAEMRAAEAGHNVEALMERAGAAAAQVALQVFNGAERWTFVCGGGANGGDGRIAARHVEAAGKEVTIVDAKAGESDLGDPHVIVDALFGTGFAGEPRPDAAALIERLNRAGAPVFAIDLPSGVDASTGEVATVAVNAVETVTFHGRKVGLVVSPGRLHSGTVHVADIGLTPAPTDARSATPALLRSVPRRREGDNKYTAGHVLVVGGSRGLTGAPSLSALAAMRADAGYVTVAAPESAMAVLEERLVEAVKRPLPEEGGVVAVGADALFGLEPADWPAPRVLTPHEGELGRLLGRDSREIAAHRIASVREAAERFACVVVLKGADTLVAAPGANLLVSALGLPSLATAGTGDVLTGVIAAFLAKGMDAQLAAVAGAAAQQRASVEAEQRAGLIASDVVEALPRALR